jgi:hypothetical protein
VTLSGNQVRAPKVRGVYIARSSNVRLSDTIVTEEPGKSRMLAAVELTGPCPGTVVRNNTLARGTTGTIVNRATEATVDER